MRPMGISKPKTMLHSTKERSMPIRTSGGIKTMRNGRTAWSMLKSPDGCSRTLGGRR